MILKKSQERAKLIEAGVKDIEEFLRYSKLIQVVDGLLIYRENTGTLIVVSNKKNDKVRVIGNCQTQNIRKHITIDCSGSGNGGGKYKGKVVVNGWGDLTVNGTFDTTITNDVTTKVYGTGKTILYSSGDMEHRSDAKMRIYGTGRTDVYNNSEIINRGNGSIYQFGHGYNSIKGGGRTSICNEDYGDSIDVKEGTIVVRGNSRVIVKENPVIVEGDYMVRVKGDAHVRVEGEGEVAVTDKNRVFVLQPGWEEYSAELDEELKY